jgi:plastocyanin
MKTHSNTIFALIGILSIVLLALTGCGSSTSSSYSATPTSTSADVVAVDCSTVVPSTTVTISGSAFSSANSVVSVSSVVKWVNNDSITHTVTSGTPASLENKFDSTLTPSASICLKFNTAGTYKYFCKIHTFMTSIVTVQ